MPQRPTNRVRSPAHLDNAYALQVQPTAVGARNYSQCDSMLIGDRAGANTYPYIQVCVCALGSGGWVGGVGLGLRGWLVGGAGWRGGMRGPEHSFRRLMAGGCGLRGWTARPCVRLPPLLPRHATKRTFCLLRQPQARRANCRLAMAGLASWAQPATLRPSLQVREPSARVEHEASTSKIGEDQLFYFQQRGIEVDDAVGMIISGFCREVTSCR